MGVNQDLISYSFTLVGSIESGGFVMFADHYTTGGSVNLTIEYPYEPLDGTFVQIKVNGGVIETWTPTGINDSHTFQVDLAAAAQLIIEGYQAQQLNLHFGEFELPAKPGVIFNETFDGGFKDFWYVNDFGSDFSTVSDSLYYELYSDGVSSWFYELCANFPVINILTNATLLNFGGDTGTIAIQLHTEQFGWVELSGCDWGDDAFDPALCTSITALTGFNGKVNGIGFRELIEPY